MNFMNKRRALVVAMAACAALASGTSFAQAWPAKPVRIVTAFAAGSASDIVARLYAQELQAEYGQAFVVENKPGASGFIAAELVAKAPADGSTLLLTTHTSSRSCLTTRSRTLPRSRVSATFCSF